MKAQLPGHIPNELQTVSLNRIVARLVAQLQPLAVKQHSFILNDVPGDFHVNADGGTLAMIIGALLNSIISRTSNNCIHVSVKRFNDIILFRLKDSKPMANRYSPHEWQKMNLLAAKIGGCIIEDDSRKKGAITLSFSNLSAAA